MRCCQENEPERIHYVPPQNTRKRNIGVGFNKTRESWTQCWRLHPVGEVVLRVRGREPRHFAENDPGVVECKEHDHDARNGQRCGTEPDAGQADCTE